jgi:hypothetical protein
LDVDISKANWWGRTKASLEFLGDTNLLTHPPNLKYEERFLKAYREARENGRGSWKSKQESILTAFFLLNLEATSFIQSFKWKAFDMK